MRRIQLVWILCCFRPFEGMFQLASSNLFLPFTVVGTDWSDVTSQNVWYRICEVIWQRMAGHVTHHPMLKPSSCFPFDSSPKFLYKFHVFQHRVDKPFTSSIDKSWDRFPLPYAAAAVVSSNNLHARICIESVCTPHRPFQQSESIRLQWFQCLLILWQMQKFRTVQPKCSWVIWQNLGTHLAFHLTIQCTQQTQPNRYHVVNPYFSHTCSHLCSCTSVSSKYFWHVQIATFIYWVEGR